MEQNQEPWGGTVSVNLNKLKNVEIVEYKGKKCITIPIDENGIYISEKGTIVLSLFMGKMSEEKWGKTHSLKRRLTGTEYKTMTKEQKNNQPVVGYFEPLKPKKNNGYQQTQQQTQQIAHPNNNFMGSGSKGSVDDLPW